jgi:hypothetical protein
MLGSVTYCEDRKMNKKIIKNRRFEEACSSSSVEDVTFISDYFAWCVYKLKRKKREEQQEEEYNAYVE